MSTPINNHNSSSLAITSPSSASLNSAGTIADVNLKIKKKFFEAAAREIFSFFRPDELAVNARVCSYWKGIINSELTGKRQCTVYAIPKRVLAARLTYQEIMKDLHSDVFAKMFGERFYRRHGMDPGPVPPIPQNFIEWAYRPDPLGEPGELVKDNYQLQFSPEYITIELDANSPLVLDKQGKHIIEVPSTSSADECKGLTRKRTLKIGLTINNLAKLAKHYFNTGISSCSREAVFHQHGDTLSAPGWSYQRKTVVGKRLPHHAFPTYALQQEFAVQAGLEIISLKDRILFTILTRIGSGIYADYNNAARTSTSAFIKRPDGAPPVTPLNMALTWNVGIITGERDAPPSLVILAMHGVGAAVGVPAEKS